MEQPAQSAPSRSLAVERLRDYLRQLPAAARNMLMSEFERALKRGEDAAVANVVLAELRKIARAEDNNDRPRAEDASRLAFACLTPFLTEDEPLLGQIRRSSIEPVWLWLSKSAVVEATAALEQAVSANTGTEEALRKFHLAAAEAIATAVSPAAGGDARRGLARVGSPSAIEDIPSIGIILGHHDALEILDTRLPTIIRSFADSQIASIRSLLVQLPSLQKPSVLPLTISTVMRRLTSPWQI